MKKMLIKSAIVSALLFVALILFLNLETYKADIPAAEKDIQKAAVNKDNSIINITQAFVPKEDNLSRIDITFNNDWGKYTDRISVGQIFKVLSANIKKTATFALFDAKEQKLLYREKFNIFARKGLKNKIFSFAPVKDSKNKELFYIVTFIAPKSSEDLEILAGEAVSAENILFINNNIVKGKSLVFSTYASPGAAGFKELLNRMSQYKPWFFKTFFLYILGYLYILGNVFIILMLVDIMRKNIKVSN